MLNHVFDASLVRLVAFNNIVVESNYIEEYLFKNIWIV